eukprot:3786715-Amphidinium_carterae.2
MAEAVHQDLDMNDVIVDDGARHVAASDLAHKHQSNNAPAVYIVGSDLMRKPTDHTILVLHHDQTGMEYFAVEDLSGVCRQVAALEHSSSAVRAALEQGVIPVTYKLAARQLLASWSATPLRVGPLPPPPQVQAPRAARVVPQPVVEDVPVHGRAPPLNEDELAAVYGQGHALLRRMGYAQSQLPPVAAVKRHHLQGSQENEKRYAWDWRAVRELHRRPDTASGRPAAAAPEVELVEDDDRTQHSATALSSHPAAESRPTHPSALPHTQLPVGESSCRGAQAYAAGQSSSSQGGEGRLHETQPKSKPMPKRRNIPTVVRHPATGAAHVVQPVADPVVVAVDLAQDDAAAPLQGVFVVPTEPAVAPATPVQVEASSGSSNESSDTSEERDVFLRRQLASVMRAARAELEINLDYISYAPWLVQSIRAQVDEAAGAKDGEFYSVMTNMPWRALALSESDKIYGRMVGARVYAELSARRRIERLREERMTLLEWIFRLLRDLSSPWSPDVTNHQIAADFIMAEGVAAIILGGLLVLDELALAVRTGPSRDLGSCAAACAAYLARDCTTGAGNFQRAQHLPH